MRFAPKVVTFALVVALLAVPAAFAKGPGGKGGPPSWAGGGGHGKPAWAGQGRGKGKQGAPGHLKKAGKAEKEVEVQQEEEPRHDNPAWICKFERDMSGGEAFADKYGTNVNKANAFGMCVSQEAHERDGVEEEEVEEAEVECPTEESTEESTEGSTEDSAETGGEVAATDESTSEEEASVSSEECEPAEEEEEEQEEAASEEEEQDESAQEEELEEQAHLLEGLNPAQFCFAEAVELGEGFATTYGTNVNLANAFGKCVSQRAHELGDESEEESADELIEEGSAEDEEEGGSTEDENAGEDADSDESGEDADSDEDVGEDEEADEASGFDLASIYAFLRL